MIEKEELKKYVGESYIRCLTKEEFRKILEMFESKLSIDEWDKFDTYTVYNDVYDEVEKSVKGYVEILANDVIKEFENNWLIKDGEKISQKIEEKSLKQSFKNILEKNSKKDIEKMTKESLERIDDFIKDSFEKTKEKHTLEKLGDNQNVTKEELEHELEKVLKNDNIEYVHHPNHYGGENNVYEAIKIIEAHDLNFVEGNVLKYLLRYKKKNGFEDLEKALWYMNRLVENYKKNN